ATSPSHTSTLSLHDALPISGEFMRAIVPCGVAAHPGIVRAGRGRSGGLGDWTYAPGPAVRGLDPGRKPMSEQFDQQRIDAALARSEEHTSELQSRFDLVCRL